MLRINDSIDNNRVSRELLFENYKYGFNSKISAVRRFAILRSAYQSGAFSWIGR